jgi:hypothetical protein
MTHTPQNNISLEDISEDPDFKRFWKSVSQNSDPVTMLLRCHLLAEFYLDSLITLAMPRGDIVIDSRLQFYDKLIIVEGLDTLPKSVTDALKRLNSLRNSCSHVLDYDITERDIDKIGFPFGDEYIKDQKIAGTNKRELLHSVLMSIMVGLSSTVNNIRNLRLKRIEEKNKNHTQKLADKFNQPGS